VPGGSSVLLDYPAFAKRRNSLADRQLSFWDSLILVDISSMRPAKADSGRAP
jgi:hypothetical protein